MAFWEAIRFWVNADICRATKNSFNLPFPHMELELINLVFSQRTWLWIPRKQEYWISDAVALISWRMVWQAGILLGNTSATFLFSLTVACNTISAIKGKKNPWAFFPLNFLFSYWLNIKVSFSCSPSNYCYSSMCLCFKDYEKQVPQII